MDQSVGVDIEPDEYVSEIQMATDTFKVATVKQHVFEDYPICPHCQCMNIPKFLKLINEDSGRLYADLLRCVSCQQFILSIMHPSSGQEPVFLEWTIKREVT